MLSDQIMLIEKQKRQSSLVSEMDVYIKVEYILAITFSQIESSIRSIGLLYNLKTQSSINHWISETFPVYHKYVPSFLILRRKKPATAVINHYRNKFDIVMIEGAGRQHPRKFGLACEIGVAQNIPIIGIIKRSLWGNIDYRFPTEYSHYTTFPVYDGDDKIAYFIKKKENKKGIFISIGNNISLDSALKIVVPMLNYRIPEPMRLANTLLKTSEKKR